MTESSDNLTRMDDLSERLAALKATNEGPLPPPDPPATWDWTDDQIKDAYLELLAEGYTPPHAAREVGKTGRYMRGFRSEKSPRYDPEFAERYDEIMRPDGEHRAAIVELAREELVKAAQSGNVRAIEKLLMAWDPEFSFLRPAAFTGDVNIDKLMVVMRDLPTPLLEQVREQIVSQRKALPDIEAA